MKVFFEAFYHLMFFKTYTIYPRYQEIEMGDTILAIFFIDILFNLYVGKIKNYAR